MPRIPLYNKGLGSAVKSPTGSLSPRASAAPFMQAGQAQAAFYQKASKIAFDFAAAQQRQETNTVLSELSTDFDKQQFEFVSKNQDTDTIKFGENYETFSQSYLSKIDARGDINEAQKRVIKEKLAPAISAARVQGARQAFNRGQERDKVATNTELESIVNKLPTLAVGSAEHDRITNRAYELIDDATARGLGIAFTRQSFDAGVALTNIEMASENATSVAQFEELRNGLKTRTDISFKQKQALNQKIDQDEVDYRSALYQDGVEFIRATSYTRDEAVAAKESLDKGQAFTLGGQEFNPQDLQPTQRGQLAAILDGDMADLQDLTSQAVSNKINRSENPFQVTVDLFKAENRADYPGTDLQLESVIGDSALDIAQDVRAKIAANDMSDINTLQRQIESATQMINHSYTDAGSLLERDSQLGEQARQTQMMLANAQSELVKAVNTSNQNDILALSLGKGQFNQTATTLGVSSSQKDDAVNSAMMNLRSDQDLFNQPQLSVASGNAVTWDFWKTNLEASSNMMSDPSFKLDDSPLGRQNLEAVEQSYELYKAMKIRGNLLHSHITDNNVMATYKAIETFEPYYGFEGAVEQVRGFDKDIERANAQFKLIEAEINTLSEDNQTYKWFSYIPFVDGIEYAPVNKASMAAEVGTLAKLMIRKGLEGEAAIKAAATLYGERHVRVMNTVLPKTETIPTQEQAQVVEGYMISAGEALLGIEKEPLEFTEELTSIRPEFAQEAAAISNKRQKAMDAGAISGKIEYIADNYELEDLMFIPRVPGSYDEWTLVTTTAQPVIMNEQGAPVILTYDQLMMYGDIASYERKERSRIQQNAELFIENNFKMRTGPFEGMTLQQAQQEKERLEGVVRIKLLPDAETMEHFYGPFEERKKEAEKLIRESVSGEKYIPFG